MNASERAAVWATQDGLLRELAVSMLACGIVGCDWIQPTGTTMCPTCRVQWDAAAEIERLSSTADLPNLPGINEDGSVSTQRMKTDRPATDFPPKIAVDAAGYYWRCYDDGYWSMCPTNPDNSPIPEPIVYYLPEAYFVVEAPPEHITHD